MSDIALINGDIHASGFGDILTVNDDDDIIQMAANNILTIYGSNQFHTDLGNKVFNQRHKISQRELIAIANESKNAILYDNRIASVVEISARDASNPPTTVGQVNISFIVETTDGKHLNSNVTITIY